MDTGINEAHRKEWVGGFGQGGLSRHELEKQRGKAFQAGGTANTKASGPKHLAYSGTAEECSIPGSWGLRRLEPNHKSPWKARSRIKSWT